MGKVLHASNSGYFPFCISELGDEEIGPGTYYPLGMSLEKVMEIYWRIKDIACSGPGDPAFTGDIQYYNKASGSLSAAQQESDIVCTDGLYVLANSPNIPIINDGQQLIFARPTTESGSSAQIIFSGGLYYPFILFSAISVVVGGGFWVGDSFAEDLAGPTSSFNFFGLTMTLYNSGIFGADPYTGSMLANSYWSYDGTWDTATGARL